MQPISSDLPGSGSGPRSAHIDGRSPIQPSPRNCLGIPVASRQEERREVTMCSCAHEAGVPTEFFESLCNNDHGGTSKNALALAVFRAISFGKLFTTEN